MIVLQVLLLILRLLEVKQKDPLKVRLLSVSAIISSCSSRRAEPIYSVSSSSHQAKPWAHRFSSVQYYLKSGRCLALISRPKTRASNSPCHHTWSPAPLYSGQWCFVSRSRSNASHQTIWARASNWTSKVSTIFQPVHVSQPPSLLNMQHQPDAFHGPFSSF